MLFRSCGGGGGCFSDPTAKNPDGSLKHPPPPPQADPKLQIEQAKAQGQMHIAQQKAEQDKAKIQADALHQQIKTQAEIEVAKIKADLDAKIALLDAHLKTALAEQKARHDQQAHHVDMVTKVVDVASTAHQHDQKMEHNDASHVAKMEQIKAKPEKKSDG